jgi:uncharacterized membrane protein
MQNGEDNNADNHQERVLGEVEEETTWKSSWQFASIAVGIGLVITGLLDILMSSVDSEWTKDAYASAIYMVFVGLILVVILIPLPMEWHTKSKIWFWALHKQRNLGAFHIVIGFLSFQCGRSSWVIGLLSILVGMTHYTLS